MVWEVITHFKLELMEVVFLVRIFAEGILVELLAMFFIEDARR